MLNLLPQDVQAQQRREYRLRLGAVALLFLAFAFIVGIVSLLPFAVSSGVELMATKRDSTSNTVAPQIDRTALDEVLAFKGELNLLVPAEPQPTYSFAKSIKDATLDKPDGVSLSSFSFASVSGEAMQLVLSGVSATRDALVEFSQRLSSDAAFSSVDLPISNLSKKSDIDFSITLTVNPADAATSTQP